MIIKIYKTIILTVVLYGCGALCLTLILIGTTTGKRPLGRPRRRWEDNIRTDLEEIGFNRGIGLIGLRIGIIGGPL